MSADLTLAMIVRDGGATLQRCLDSVKGVAQAIVVVDTGSLDDSVSIAKKAGAEVVEIPWPDAFDEARNVSLDHVKTEWTLVLDADEWLDEQAPAILAKDLQREDAAGFFLPRRDFDAHGAFTEQYMLRLFRNRPEVRFRGIIHEQIYPDALREASGLPEVSFSQARFNHDGYAVDSTREKDLNEIRMIQRELDVRPGQLYYQCLQAVLELKNELPEGPGRLRRIVQECLDREFDAQPPNQEVALPLAIALQRVSGPDLNSNRTQRLVKLCVKWFSKSPFVVYALAEHERRRNNVQGRHRYLCLLADMAVSGNYSRHRSFDPNILGAWLWESLIATASVIGPKQHAIEAAKRLLAIDPDSELAQNVLKTQ